MVPLSIWAFFSAYEAIVLYGTINFHLLHLNGVPPLQVSNCLKLLPTLQLIFSDEKITEIKNEDLPRYLYLIESKIVSEWQLFVSGMSLDKEKIERANLIIQTVAQTTLNYKKTIPLFSI